MRQTSSALFGGANLKPALRVNKKWGHALKAHVPVIIYMLLFSFKNF